MRSHFIINQKLTFLTAIVYLGCFIWVIFLTQGLPIGDPDDWDHMLVAQDLAWKTVLTKLLTPWSISHLWMGQVDRLNAMTNRRIFSTVLVKSVISVFGYNSLALHIFAKALFFSGTVALLFFLLTQTGSLSNSILGTLFFVLIPAHYPHVLWISDPVTIVHCLMVLAFTAFLALEKRIVQDNQSRGFYGLFLTMFVSGYLAIKTKEPALIFPLATGFYLITHFKEWRLHRNKWLFILIALVILAFQIIPFGESLNRTEAGSSLPTFRLSHLLRMLFRNYDVGYDDEPTSAFFSIERLWPVSIARTFGFFVLWILTIFCVLYWVSRIRLKLNFEFYFMNQPIIKISMLWAIAEIALMGCFQTDPRYFSGTMIPLTLISVRLIYCVSKIYPKLWKYFLRYALFAALIWSVIYNNLSHVIYIRRLIGQRVNRFFYTAKQIYADAFPNNPQDLRSLGFFYCAACIPPSNHPRIKDVSYFIDVNFDIWNHAKTFTIDEFKKLAVAGKRYYVGFDQNRFASDLSVRLIGTVDGFNKESLFEQLLYQFRKKPRVLYIMKNQT